MRYPFPTILFGNPAAFPDTTMVILALVTAVIVVTLGVYCMTYCLNDLLQRTIVTGGNKQLWAAIIMLGDPLGQVAYWVYGRGP